MIDQEHYNKPILHPILRTLGCIPINIRQSHSAIRAAAEKIAEGEIVCLFPEGQITRTGLLVPFQRGLERIVKGRNVPIIPVHIDRATASVFSPVRGSYLPQRIPFPVTISFGEPLPNGLRLRTDAGI